MVAAWKASDRFHKRQLAAVRKALTREPVPERHLRSDAL